VTTQVPLTHACGRTSLLPVLHTLVAMQVFLDLNTRLRNNRFPPQTTHALDLTSLFIYDARLSATDALIFNARSPSGRSPLVRNARSHVDRSPSCWTHACRRTDLLPEHTLNRLRVPFSSHTRLAPTILLVDLHTLACVRFPSSPYARLLFYSSPLYSTHALLPPPMRVRTLSLQFFLIYKFSAACSSLRRRASTAELCRGTRQNRPFSVLCA